MLTPQVPVAKEGYPFIAFCAFCTLILALLGFTIATFTGLVVTIFVLCFFRDPERFIPPDENCLVSPADGKVITLEQVDDQRFTGQTAWKVSIFMNVFNVHVNRVPFSGTVEKVIYHPGKFYSADSERGGLENEYCASIIKTETDQRVAFVQIAGLIARRIICWLEPADTVVKGRRFGLIRFGSRVDLYLPADSEIIVKMDEKVRAGETVLARLKDK